MIKKWLLILSLAFVFFPVSAAQQNDLYRIEASATGDNKQDQQHAFELLMLRLTGDASSSSNALVAKAKGNINPYIQQFSFGDDMISVLFNESKVNQLLMQAQLRLWGKQRPNIILWYANEQNFNRDLLADSSQKEWLQQSRQQAQLLGLPIRLPVMDLEDSMAVNVNDVWGGFDGPLYTASERYATPLVLSFRQYPQGQSWQIQWRLLDGTSQVQLDSGQVQASLEQVGAEAMSAVSASLAARYGVVLGEGEAEASLVSFANVTSINKYVELERFLNQQPSVASVTLHHVQHDIFTFEVQLLSPWEDLQASLDIAPRLQADELRAKYYYFQ
ncbi:MULTISPECIES: DUF2066 domain-containing protein [unclassified Agarivorans]|uniref:DUF2066 domain-containing protein n=1 Tax=unclassified Agarivorans TaxID=2636026 RepID=UPI0026E3D9E2|nr:MULTISPECIES: DUF2066 domain-containing protein [unclassified Agarivorans]MDO6687969.1 DUF2066 domain-containing protein [Agarivorans sp. 3_MG-2023]MDO6717614.1 DUF2066 domain-containing protein [Agarivorans sp. 2_MG-2023]